MLALVRARRPRGEHRQPADTARARGRLAASRARPPVSAELPRFLSRPPVLITGGLGFIGQQPRARAWSTLGADVLLVDSLIPDYGGNLFNIDGIDDARARQHRRRPAGSRR